MKYLVCDDSKMARKMLIKDLKNLLGQEIEVFEATNGLEALKLYEEVSPTITFMDLTMPEMNGFDAVEKICKEDKDAKIIVVSADIQEASKAKAKENGALGFIKKPINEENLKQILLKLKVL
ncbi:MAG: response regulator [Arcobacter sp.]|uniref:response regulator n=1 Tax=Arcobacter sp. TaxID=1872629 RepID=UPI003C74BF54